MKVITVLIIYLLFIGLSIGVVGLFTKIACWAFGFVFSWKLAVDVWTVLILASWALKPSKGE